MAFECMSAEALVASWHGLRRQLWQIGQNALTECGKDVEITCLREQLEMLEGAMSSRGIPLPTDADVE